MNRRCGRCGLPGRFSQQRHPADAGLDWIGFSQDGATAEVYEAIRPGTGLIRVCTGINDISRLKRNGRPRVILNFVMRTVNIHQLADLVRLAANLGVDRINFKQRDVIRAVNREAPGLFGLRRKKKIMALEKQLKRLTVCRRNVPGLPLPVWF